MKLPCSCQHKQQDELNGNGIRVMNQIKTGEYRCTVCGKITDKARFAVPKQVTKKK